MIPCLTLLVVGAGLWLAAKTVELLAKVLGRLLKAFIWLAIFGVVITALGAL